MRVQHEAQDEFVTWKSSLQAYGKKTWGCENYWILQEWQSGIEHDSDMLESSSRLHCLNGVNVLASARDPLADCPKYRKR